MTPQVVITGMGATTPVGCAVGACRMPCQADEQTAVVPIIGGPPILALRHQLRQVVFECRIVQLLKSFAVIEIGIHRAGYRCVLVQDGQVELIGPPLCVGLSALLGACTTRSVEGASAGFRYLTHLGLLQEKN